MYNLNSLRAIPIIELASRLGIAVKGGKALCFKHSEKEPSLSFDEKRNIFKCFGCEIGGDTIKLYMLYKDVEFKQAVEELAEMYGMVKEESISAKFQKFKKAEDKQEIKLTSKKFIPKTITTAKELPPPASEGVTLVVPSTWDIEVAFYIGWFLNKFDNLPKEQFILAVKGKNLEISEPEKYYAGIREEIFKGDSANKKGIEIHLEALYSRFSNG